MRPKGTPQSLQQRRYRAIGLLQRGYSYRTVARMVHAALGSVERWHKLYRRKGKRGLRPRRIPGRPPKLSPKRRKRLLRVLLHGPFASGFLTDAWTLCRVRKVIWRLFHIKCSLSSIWELLVDSFGWTHQRPAKRAKERDERTIEHWKRYEWPRIKKMLISSAQLLFLLMKAAFCPPQSSSPAGVRADKRL